MDKLEIIVKALDDKLAKDIVVIDMQLASPVFDTFVVCSADNERLMNALKDSVEDSMAENGYEVRTPKWVREKDFFSLKDFGGVFLPGHPSTWIYRNIYREPRYDYTVIYKAHTLIADRTIATILLSQGNFGFISRTMSCYRSIIKKNGQNVTSKLFVENDDSKLIEYQLTLKLEAYAQNELKVHVDFSRFRRLLFIKSIIKLLIKPSHKRWLCAKGIISLRLRAFMSVKGDY